MANPPRPVPTNLEVAPGMETIYANLARISHSPADIVMDFAHALPGENKAVIKARVLMSPLSAKLFYRALGDNIARFEAAFGGMTIPRNTSPAEHLFRPHQPPEPPADNKEK